MLMFIGAASGSRLTNKARMQPAIPDAKLTTKSPRIPMRSKKIPPTMNAANLPAFVNRFIVPIAFVPSDFS